MFIKVEGLVACWMVSLLSLTTLCAADFGGADARKNQSLVEGAKNQDISAVRVLLKEGADVNTAQGDGSTALHWAAHWDDLLMADLLMRAGAKVNLVDDLGVTPLYLACVNGSVAMVNKLLEARANPNLAALTGVSPLMEAARSGSVEAVQSLLAHEANVNAKEASAGQTALMWAVAQRHPDVVRILVDHGADVDAHSQPRDVLVTISGGGSETQPRCFTRKAGGGEESGSVSVLRCHPRGPARVVQMGGSTPSMFAARQGCIECARPLLDGRANVNESAADGNSALVLAAHSGQGKFAAFLLDHGANSNLDGAGYTALHAAVMRDDVELVKALLSHGANVNAQLVNGTPWRHNSPDFSLPESLIGATPFLLAANYASSDMMRLLATSGADVTMTAKDGTTALMAAAEAKNTFAFIDPVFGPGGANPVAESDALKAVKLMVDLGADVSAVNDAGDCAVHIAAARGYSTVIQFLVDKGARVNVKNKLGQTPLAVTMVVVRRFDNNLAGAVKIKQASVMPRFRSTADLLRKLGATE